MICYLCGKELSEKEVLTTEEEKSLTTTHREHILHNAILGRLVSKKILCKKCGNSFSCDDDASFTSLFAPIVSRLENCGAYPRRSTNSVAKTGYLHTSDGKITDTIVAEKDGMIFKIDSKYPDYSIDEATKTVIVKASSCRTKSFKNQLIKEKSELASYTFKAEDYSSSGDHIAYFFSENNPNFNEVFSKGLVKIALEFALDCGVSREDIPLVLTVNTDGSSKVNYSNPQIIPYAPLSSCIDECKYEYSKHLFGNYPYHILSLFDVDNMDSTRSLICYIDLFSTFQYYVLLNKDYGGPSIDKYYGQRLLRKNDDGKDLPPEFDVRSYLIDNKYDPVTFKRTIFDIDTSSNFPTPYLCNGIFIENKDYVVAHTNRLFKQLELFLFG